MKWLLVWIVWEFSGTLSLPQGEVYDTREACAAAATAVQAMVHKDYTTQIKAGCVPVTPRTPAPGAVPR